MAGTRTGLSGGAPSLLVVDDEPSMLELLACYFAREGFRVTVARDGLEAVERVHEEPPDLVLLNLLMPVMNGFRACRALKAAPSTRHIPVIIFSACDDEKSMTTAFSLGAEDYITTPLSTRDTADRIRSVLRRYEIFDF